MPHDPSFAATIARYEKLVIAALPEAAPFVAVNEGSLSVQLERGAVFAAAMKSAYTPQAAAAVERLLELASSSPLEQIVVVDAAAQHRPLYRPLLIYACLSTFRLWYETLPQSEFGRWEEGLRRWCDLLEAELGGISWPASAIPAARGASAAEAAWTALALQVAGKVYIRDAWSDLAADAFGRLTRSQLPDGRFLVSTGSENPDTLSYHELAILHAAASS